MTPPRAAVLVTGSELVRGELEDRNGPFLARELIARGLDVAEVVVVGDRPDDLEAALRRASAADLCVVSGGLGPTHDDRTVEILARVAGRELVVDRGLEAEIEHVSRRFAERSGRPYVEFRPGVRKQASMPEGALLVGLAGTAPALVVETGGAVVVVLPGPPGELRRLWPPALDLEPVRRVLARARPGERRTLRFFGVGESVVARAFEEAGGEGEGVEATICARQLEIVVDLVAALGGEERADALAASLRSRLGQFLFAEDGRPIAELVLALCRARSLGLATAESCTGGLVGARLTSVPGSSDVYAGGVVAYSDAVKRDALGVPAGLLEAHGAVSPEVAAAMADGARRRLGADVAVAVTGIAGPRGGTPEKPVGLLHLHAAGPDGARARTLNLPGDRATIRERGAAAALHLVRELLSQNRDDRA